MAIAKLRMCAACMNIRIKTWDMAMTSRPIGPAISSPASAKVWTRGYANLNCPIMNPVYHASTPRANIKSRPLEIGNQLWEDTATIHDDHGIKI